MSEPASGAKPSRYQTPNARFQHIFVVVRMTTPESIAGERLMDEDDVSLTKAFLTEAAAETEAARLNQLNPQHSQYFVLVARFVPNS
jgi:hypothetical protein